MNLEYWCVGHIGSWEVKLRCFKEREREFDLCNARLDICIMKQHRFAKKNCRVDLPFTESFEY